VKKEMLAAAAEFGDERRTPIVARAEAKALSETDLAGSEPVTVVVSARGWIRAAKGHDIDPSSLSYKSGDQFLFALKGKSNQPLVLLDSTGRSYSLPAHGLPSARGQGEPITGKLNPPSGAEFVGGMMGEEEKICLLGTDAGYGFFAKLGDLVSKNKAGKAAISIPDGGKVLPPLPVNSLEKSQVVAVSNEGRLLLFPATELPMLAKGKGNRIMGIPPSRVKDREEFLAGIALLEEGDTLLVYAGKRHIALRMADLEHYRSERGRRGNKLPRGFQKVDRVEVERKG
jgi:topoisomerase-4 subunit A